MPLRPRNVIDESDPRVAQIGHPAPPWLVNYADLMTELVCFFIILYALSAALNPGVQKAEAQIKEMKEKGELPGEVKTKMTAEGYKIIIEETGDAIYFESGSAIPTRKAFEIVDKLAPVFLKINNEIIVEGHTDNVPISANMRTKYASNWELSTARATSIVRYLVDKWKVSQKRLAAIGYGENKPLYPNDTPEHKAKNRRVVFFIKNPPPQKQEFGK